MEKAGNDRNIFTGVDPSSAHCTQTNDGEVDCSLKVSINSVLNLSKLKWIYIVINADLKQLYYENQQFIYFPMEFKKKSTSSRSIIL
jgi:hypothetical protein